MGGLGLSLWVGATRAAPLRDDDDDDDDDGRGDGRGDGRRTTGVDGRVCVDDGVVGDARIGVERGETGVGVRGARWRRSVQRQGVQGGGSARGGGV